MAPSSNVSNPRCQDSSIANITQQQEECTNKSKVERGKTTGLGVAKKRKKSATGKLQVIIPDDKMVPVGQGASDFVTEVSVSVRKIVPQNVEKWRYVPKAAQENMIKKVLDAFNIEDTQHNKDVIMDAAQRAFRSTRGRLHSHFKKFETKEQDLENIPEDVSEGDWAYLVDLFSTPAYKAMSARNKLNKSKQVINHICGRKSFQAVSFDARDPETQKEPNYQELWIMTHRKNNGQWVDQASEEVHERVQQVSTEMLQDVDEETNKDTIVNEAFKSIVGERSGYCRGLGNGVKPTKGKSITGLHEQLASEREKRQSIEMKLKEVETQLQEERSKREELTTHVEESQRQFQEKIEKTVEERVASLSESQLKEIIDKQVQERLTSFFFQHAELLWWWKMKWGMITSLIYL